jgi:hypothetical protein
MNNFSNQMNIFTTGNENGFFRVMTKTMIKFLDYPVYPGQEVTLPGLNKMPIIDSEVN